MMQAAATQVEVPFAASKRRNIYPISKHEKWVDTQPQMPTPYEPETIGYEFSDCVLDTQRQELRRAGTQIKLRRKVYQVLAVILILEIRTYRV